MTTEETRTTERFTVTSTDVGDDAAFGVLDAETGEIEWTGPDEAAAVELAEQRNESDRKARGE